MRWHLKRRWARVRTECRDAVQLLLAPGLAALVPWGAAYQLGRWMLSWMPLYGSSARQAWAQFQPRQQPAEAEAAWLRRRRLVTWVDHADYYLAATRSDAWMDRHLQVTGQWPEPGRAALLFTFHWGAGMWGLRHASRSGLMPRALVASTGGAPFAGRAVLGWYARARTACVMRALRCEPLDVSGSLRPAIKTLREGGQVLAAIDVPADQASSAEPISLLGLQAAVPRALHRLAVDQKVPVYVYLTGFDAATGRRTLKIVSLGVHDNVATLINAVFAHLEQALREDPAAWHFWAEAPRFFRDE
ncbi:hypothetical protein [Paracidovorax sp. MALMAid1276]|uniref:hypothetical protein n=1 Tax=Paracidovorax sp. MALMAid1276 TaxID=3411631 RepID=UPI003B9DC2BF